jgi:hypothetical protein
MYTVAVGSVEIKGGKFIRQVPTFWKWRARKQAWLEFYACQRSREDKATANARTAGNQKLRKVIKQTARAL